MTISIRNLKGQLNLHPFFCVCATFHSDLIVVYLFYVFIRFIHHLPCLNGECMAAYIKKNYNYKTTPKTTNLLKNKISIKTEEEKIFTSLNKEHPMNSNQSSGLYLCKIISPP